MANTVTKTWSKAGSDPGQKIELTVKYTSRDAGTVKVSYTIKATSLGQDDMTSTRYNKYTLTVGGESVSDTYKLAGNKASKTLSGTITIKEVKGSVTSLTVKFKNERKKTSSDKYTSKLTTGVISQTTVGDLTIDAGPKYAVTFNAGYTGNVTNVPETQYCYCLESITIPEKPITDVSGAYSCSGYSLIQSGNPNTSAVDVAFGSTYSAVADITLYGTWRAESHEYVFYTDSTLGTAFPNATEFQNPQNPSTGAVVTLPNLPVLYASTGKEIYNKAGYTFGGWNYRASSGKTGYGAYTCSEPCGVSFYPNWYIPVVYNSITFDYNYNNRKVTKSIQQGDSFNLSSLMTTESGATATDTTIRNGYKLIGWSTTKNDPVAVDKGAALIKYKTTDTITSAENTTLYAVWEYYSTIMVYTEGDYRPAIPYVYDKKGKWNQATLYIYNGTKYIKI